MTALEILEKILETTEPTIKSRLQTVLSEACTDYNMVLFVKNRRTAGLMFSLLKKEYVEKIRTLCSREMGKSQLMSFALNVNKINYCKYFHALDIFWTVNKEGLDVWSIPEPGEMLKTKKELTTTKGTVVLAGTKVKLLTFIHEIGHGNVLQAYLRTPEGEKLICSCGHVKRHSNNNFSHLTQ